MGRQLKTDKDGNIIVDTDNNPLFSPEQLGIINNTLAITKDNWQSVATAIGKIYLYHDNETDKDVFDYGVAGSIILGQMFVGKTLSLLGSPRDDGTYAITLNENGLTIINDGTTAGITIKDAAGNKQFYADADGNLILSGGINSDFGKVGGWTINNHKIYAGGAERAYRKAVDKLTELLVAEGAIHAVWLKQKSKTKRKKKIATAIYEYQADCDGEWGAISFDFQNGKAEVIRLADWDTVKTNKFASRAIAYLLNCENEKLPTKTMLAFEP